MDYDPNDSATGTAFSRRTFLKASALAGGGMLLAFELPGATAAPATFTPNAYITIGRDGKATLTMPFAEMGQGTYTSIPMLFAEELEIKLDDVILVHAPANEKLYAHPMFGAQLTGASASIRGGWEPYRKAGASARVMLVEAAADQWKVKPETCVAKDGKVVHTPSGRTLGYGALAASAAARPVPANVTLKAPAAFKLIGTAPKRLDTKAKTDGTAKFGIDVYLPGMKIAAVAACPVFGGKLGKVDDSKALRVKGVRQVVKLDDAVAVIADHNGAARKGLAALAITWDEGPNAGFSSQAWGEQLVQATKGKGLVALDRGNFKQAASSGARRIDAVYRAPPLAHATMEPMNCTVHYRKTECEVWTGTQASGRAQAFVAKATGLAPEKVKINNFLLGGGFGRRLDVDHIEQAARIAMQVNGPVKVIWSREEDMQHDFYRPYYYDEVSALLDQQGKPVGWNHRFSGSAIEARYAPAWMKDGVLDTDAIDAVETPYDFANAYIEYFPSEPPAGLRTGFWRGVGPTHHTFVNECFMDELAATAKQDPVAYRRAMLGKNPRALAVLNLAAEKAGWGRKLPAGSGMGVSLCTAWGSYAAQVMEVAVNKDGQVQLKRIVTAVDCGQPISTDGVVAQMQSGHVFGLTAVLYGTITIQNGRIQQSNFHDYAVLRMNEMPQVEVHIVPSHETPGGVGEIGTAVVAPALLNAIYAATGKRLRTYPVVAAELKKENA